MGRLSGGRGVRGPSIDSHVARFHIGPQCKIVFDKSVLITLFCETNLKKKKGTDGGREEKNLPELATHMGEPQCRHFELESPGLGM